jgi:hypothetical protein
MKVTFTRVTETKTEIETAEWNAAISGYASASYKLAYDDTKDRMMFSALA